MGEGQHHEEIAQGTKVPKNLPDRGYIRKDFLSQIWGNSRRLAGRNNNNNNNKKFGMIFFSENPKSTRNLNFDIFGQKICQIEVRSALLS